LDRAALTNLFSNFIDIWNLHKAFFEALTEYLSPMPLSATVLGTADPAISQPPLPLSPILLSHFPYLSLYNPFITAFPSILSTLASLTSPPSFSHPNPNYSKPFSEFLVKQESDPQCGKLKFRDWMLTIVQRCPRYLLLLKDLRRCTEPIGGDELDEEDEYEKLGRVLDLVSKSKFKIRIVNCRTNYVIPSHVLAQHLSPNSRRDSFTHFFATLHRQSPTLSSLPVRPSRAQAPQTRTAIPNREK
jgi:FYVE/RhoGEF/PH domain-containing protein 5/6